MCIDKLKKFHGSEYVETNWNSKISPSCRLCKTQNTNGKSKHWAKGLCRSCYRRLSATHRFYNDSWNKEHAKCIDTRKSHGKKDYKTQDVDFNFSEKDISTLLSRYDYKCAYCKTDLQSYNHKDLNAFQVEYKIIESKPTLVPICRGCNCSKKNINEESKLARWAQDKGVTYPFVFIESID